MSSWLIFKGVKDMYAERVLTQAYDLINYNYFDGRLPVVSFSVRVAKQTKNGWGVNKEHEVYLIYVYDYCLFEDVESIYIGLMHQISHIINAENNVKDTSRKGQYHNKAFKKVAEKNGLITRRTDANGFDAVGIKKEVLDKIIIPDLRRRLNQAIEKDMAIERNQSKRIKKMVRFCCPNCKRKATAGLTMKLVCGYCMVEMEHRGYDLGTYCEEEKD